MQTLLDRFRTHYNEAPTPRDRRSHPAERYLPTEPDQPTYPNHAVVRKIGPPGDVGYDGLIIGLGRRWAGAHVRIDAVDQLVPSTTAPRRVRSLLPDRSRIYQSRNLRTKGGPSDKHQQRSPMSPERGVTDVSGTNSGAPVTFRTVLAHWSCGRGIGRICRVPSEHCGQWMSLLISRQLAARVSGRGERGLAGGLRSDPK